MKVLVKKGKSLLNFLLGEELQTVVSIKLADSKGADKYFLTKIPDSTGTVHVYGKMLLKGTKEPFYFDFSGMKYILSFNKEYDYCIYEESDLDITEELKGKKGIFVSSKSEISSILKAIYTKAYTSLLEANMGQIKKSKEYFDAIKEEEAKKSLIKQNIKDYIYRNERPIWECKPLMVQTGAIEDRYKNGGRYANLNNPIAGVIFGYMSVPNFLEGLALKNFKIDLDIKSVAIMTYRNKLYDELISTPDNELLVFEEIKKAILDAGKTLNIKKKGEEGFTKVINPVNGLRDNYFETVTGGMAINILEVEEITFSGKVLYSKK